MQVRPCNVIIALCAFILVALASCVVIVDITTGVTEEAPVIELTSTSTDTSTGTDTGETESATIDAPTSTGIASTGERITECNTRYCAR